MRKRDVLTCFILLLPAVIIAAPKKVYFSYTLHGNMNYDRYPKSTIWEKFPETYQNVLDFIEARPEFKGQIQLSGQTFKTLQQAAPGFLLQALQMHRQGLADVSLVVDQQHPHIVFPSGLTPAKSGTSAEAAPGGTIVWLAATPGPPDPVLG